MNCTAIAELPPASRSRLLNRPLHGLDGRSSEGRAIRDVVAGLLAEHGGEEAPVRLLLLARAAARCWVSLQALEALETTSADAVIDRAGDIAKTASKLGVALRRLESLMERTPKPAGRKTAPSVEEYLKAAHPAV